MYLENLTRIGLRILNLEQSTEGELDVLSINYAISFSEAQ